MENLNMIDEELKEMFQRIEDLWNQYREEALKVIYEWEKQRLPLVERLNIVRNLVDTYEKEIEELKVKIELGLEELNKVNEKIERLSSELERLKNELNQLTEIINKYDDLSRIHLKRAGLPVKLSSEEIKKRIEELNKMHEEGIIDDETYNKLLEELEAQLALVE